MNEEKSKDEWCMWTLSIEDIRETASRMGVLLDKKDFEEIARLTKKGIEWGLNDIWEEVIENAIRDTLKDKEKEFRKERGLKEE